MHDDAEEVASADQDAWVALLEATRAELAKMVPLIPAMKPDEIRTMVGAVQDAMWSHHQAITFDTRVKRESTKGLFTE